MTYIYPSNPFIWKQPSTQVVNVVSLIRQHLSTSNCYLQANSTKYIKGIGYNFIKIGNWDSYFTTGLKLRSNVLPVEGIKYLLVVLTTVYSVIIIFKPKEWQK
jgi:hypothetical protein